MTVTAPENYFPNRVSISSQNVVLIIQRLKKVLGLKKDVELAQFFDVAQNTISAWKKRNSMNYELLFEKCAANNIDLNWLIYGEQKYQEEFESGAFYSFHDESSDDPGSETEEEEYPTPYQILSRLEDSSPIKAEDMDKSVLNFVKMINDLPWPVSVRRKIFENYIQIIHQELNVAEE